MVFPGAADDAIPSLESEIARLYARRRWVPQNEIGVAVPVGSLLFRSEQIAVALNAVTVFSTGMDLRFEVVRRTPADLAHPSWSPPRPPSTRAETDPAVAAPLVSVDIADGRTAVCAGSRRPPQGTAAGEPGLVCTYTGGHAIREAIHYLLTPLPPPGPLTITLAWPEQGIPQTSLVLDGAEVTAAATRVITLWPDRAPGHKPPPHSSWPMNN